jgi:hypothetical protein
MAYLHCNKNYLLENGVSGQALGAVGKTVG